MARSNGQFDDQKTERSVLSVFQGSAEPKAGTGLPSVRSRALQDGWMGEAAWRLPFSTDVSSKAHC
jgi:hypothetical protein